MPLLLAAVAQQGRNAPLRRRGRVFVCILGVAICLSGRKVVAQDAGQQDRSQNSSSTLTLRVVTDLVHIPVLVLTPRLQLLPTPIAPSRFTIQLGHSPMSRPKYVRREGDDPVDLAFVVDTRLPQQDLLPKIDTAIADLAPAYLRPSDRIFIYATDCTKLSTVADVPADRAQLKSAVDLALSGWADRHRPKKENGCSAETHLWDDLEYVVAKLANQSGWRAIVAVTNGDDRVSKHSLEELIRTAQDGQVAIFGLDPMQEFRRGPLSTDRTIRQLTALCESSGGVRLDLYQSSTAERMHQFIQMLRSRYILEFPRPANTKPGNLSMSIRINHSDAFIVAAGDGVPTTDEAPAVEPSSAPESSLATSQAEHNLNGATPVAEGPPTAQPAGEAHSTQRPQPAAEPQQAQQPAAMQSMAQPPSNTAAATQSEIPERATPSATPLFKASIRLTVVDVTATDAKDQPVRGLTQPEFTVKEDGKPQVIKNFEEYGAERPESQAAEPQLPPDTYTNAQPAAPTTSAVNVLMFDDVTTGLGNHFSAAPEYLMYARQQAIKYLKTMPAGTRVAVLELADSLRLVQDFTPDRNVLLTAVSALFYKRVHGVNFLSGDPPKVLDEACGVANAQSELTVDALEETSAFLSGIEGRKNLIWFTPGIPWLTGFPEFARVPCLHDYTLELQRAYGLLTAAQVSLYPVDPRGAEACSYPINPDPKHPAPDPQYCMRWMQALATDHNSMQEMAKATGGQAYYNRNDLDAAMGEAIATGADYYSLSYVPPLSKYDSQYHKIDVKVARPGIHLQYRDGYTAIDLAKHPQLAETSSGKSEPQSEDELRAAMGHGGAPSTQLLFDVRVAPSSAPVKPGDPAVIGKPVAALKGKHLVRYDFEYALHPDQITLGSEASGKRDASIDFVIVAYDTEGKPLSVLTENANVAVRADRLSEWLQRPLRLPVQFDLPTGNISVRIGVRDVPSGNVGTLEIPLTVIKPKE